MTNGRVSLDERACWVDTWALGQGLAEVDRQMGRGAPVSELVKLARRLRVLYRGPLLADEVSSWVIVPRNKIAASFQRATERLAATLSAGGQLEDARALQDCASRREH